MTNATTAPVLTKEAVKAWALALPEPPTVRMILYALADHLDSASGTASASFAQIAEACHISVATAIRHIRYCSYKGYLAHQRLRRPDGPQQNNLYLFPLDRVAIP